MSAKLNTKHVLDQGTIAYTRKLCKSFSGKLALDNVDIDINASQILAILGANGAGKTTMINILLGRLKADSGEVNVFSSPPGSLPAKRQSGALLQVASLPDKLKIREHIQLFRSYYPSPMAYDQIIEYSGLAELQDRYAKKLSGGEKQRLLFALSICGRPKLLFLDEPTVGMDIESRQKLWQAIKCLKEQGTAVILTTHYLEEADKLADEIVMLKDGKIIKRGSPQEVKATVGHSEIYFQTPQQTSDFAHLPGFLSSFEKDGFTYLQTRSLNQCLLALLQAYPDIKELGINKAGIEEAFLQLNKTQKNQEI